MGIKKGTKLTDTPKEVNYHIRVDEETDRKAKEVCRRESISKSEAVRQGIELKYKGLKNDDIIEFQLPISESNNTISSRTKVHIFVNGNSLCGKHSMVANHFHTTDVDEKDLHKHPESFCKICREKYLNGLGGQE